MKFNLCCQATYLQLGYDSESLFMILILDLGNNSQFPSSCTYLGMLLPNTIVRFPFYIPIGAGDFECRHDAACYLGI